MNLTEKMHSKITVIYFIISKRETIEQKIIAFIKIKESLSRIRQLANTRLERVEYTISYFNERNQILDHKKRNLLPKLIP